MATSEQPIVVRRRDGVAVIDMVGDVNAQAEGALETAWAEATREPPDAVVLNFEGTGFINSTRTTARSSRSRGSLTTWPSPPTRTAPCSARREATHD